MSNDNKGSNQSKKTNAPIIITAIVLVCIAVIVVIFRNGGNNSNDNGISSNNSNVPESNSEESVSSQVIHSGEYLAISSEEVSDTAAFYPIEVDGTEMEVFAIRASDGTIRTAFNTCQSCYTSGAGYYLQEGDDLVCQNCGFHFTPDQVEIQSGGCNPWPIFAENKVETEKEIQIPYEFLKESSGIFANWKK